LENRGVVTRSVKPTSPPTVEYSLTELGVKLGPILDAIAEVGVGLTPKSDRAPSSRSAGEKAEVLLTV
jgi:DNA-binding HxlR family transcriptional regulator